MEIYITNLNTISMMESLYNNERKKWVGVKYLN